MAFSCSYYSSVSLALVFALLFFTTQTKVEAVIDPLLPICKTVGGGSTFVGIDFCMRALGSDKRSRHADGYAGFSVIAVDLLTANTTSTVAKIEGLLHKGGDATMVKCLESCQTLYRGIVGRQPGCTAAVKSHKFDEAKSSLEQSASATKECEDGFGNSHVASPVTVENDNAFKLAKLVVALIHFAT